MASTPLDFDLAGRVVCVVGGPDPLQTDASVFEELRVRELEENAARIEEAFIALARTVFTCRGRLAFHDDPLFRPLANQLAREYWHPPDAEPIGPQEHEAPLHSPAIVYGALTHIDEDSPVRSGFEFLEVRDRPPTNVAGIVAIGAGEGMFAELAMLAEASRRRLPLFLIGSTGALSVKRFKAEDWPADDLENDDWESLQTHIREFRIAPEQESPTGGFPEQQLPEFRFSIYPVVAMRIVERLAQSVK